MFHTGRIGKAFALPKDIHLYLISQELDHKVTSNFKNTGEAIFLFSFKAGHIVSLNKVKFLLVGSRGSKFGIGHQQDHCEKLGQISMVSEG